MRHLLGPWNAGGKQTFHFLGTALNATQTEKLFSSEGSLLALFSFLGQLPVRKYGLDQN